MLPTNLNTQNNLTPKKSNRLRLFELIVCALFGALMFCSKEIMAVLPNIHLLGLLIMLATISFRFKALISIYIYVFVEAFLQGFSAWWVPNLYTWTILWGITMLIPKKLPTKAKLVVYPIVCSLHGFLYGTLCAPAQAVFFGLDFNGAIAWIITGIPYDIIHGISNLLIGTFVLPLSISLNKILAKIK
jgi:energy-coupling factor transport system substrate-specific component